MRSSIHILLAILFGSIYFDKFPNQNLFLQISFAIVLIFGVLLPDIDKASSTIGQKFGLFSKFIQKFFKHRGFFHSVWIILIFYIVFNFLISKYFQINNLVLNGFFIGYASHLIGDALTVNGIKPFYPFNFRIAGPIRTGKLSELILAFLIIIWLVTH